MIAEIDKVELKVWLRTLGYTQKDLAEILTDTYGVKTEYKALNKMINKKQQWSLDVAMGIADILDVPFNQLFILKKR